MEKEYWRWIPSIVWDKLKEYCSIYNKNKIWEWQNCWISFCENKADGFILTYSMSKPMCICKKHMEYLHNTSK